MEGLIILNDYQVATLKEYYGDKYKKKVTKKVKKFVEKLVDKADKAIDNMYEELDGCECEVHSFQEIIDNMSEEEKTKFFDAISDEINRKINS